MLLLGMRASKMVWLDGFWRSGKECENRMVADPDINRPFEENLRKCRFEVFPYALIYRIIAMDTLQVLAVMQLNRRPGYWKDREDC